MVKFRSDDRYNRISSYDFLLSRFHLSVMINLSNFMKSFRCILSAVADPGFPPEGRGISGNYWKPVVNEV